MKFFIFIIINYPHLKQKEVYETKSFKLSEEKKED